MAALPLSDREKIGRGLMRYWSKSIADVFPGILKPDLQAAIDATDTWIDQNQVSYNSALPATFRANASTAEKTLLFCAVALARVSIDLLRKVFGEVD